MIRRTYNGLPLILLLLTLPGCGPADPLGRRAVNGRITLDGTPLESGHIQFTPQKPNGVAGGAMIAHGEYRLAAQQGLPPGKYYVQIFSPQATPAPEKASHSPGAPAVTPSNVPDGALRLGIERIPSQYNSASKLMVEVTASGLTTFDFDMKSIM